MICIILTIYNIYILVTIIVILIKTGCGWCAGALQGAVCGGQDRPADGVPGGQPPGRPHGHPLWLEGQGEDQKGEHLPSAFLLEVRCLQECLGCTGRGREATFLVFH